MKKEQNAVADLNERRNVEFKREWEAIQQEHARYELTGYQFNAVLDELLNTLDQYFIESAFNFRNNLDHEQGEWSHHPFLEGSIGKLNPLARHLEKKLRTAVADKYPGQPGEPDADLTLMTVQIEECAYIIGVFMGAKLAGASKEKLNALKEHLVV